MPMNYQPICGKCNQVMTRENARIHPEYFLHDACLPQELKPTTMIAQGPTFPGECADCGMTVRSDAEAFLHANVHADQGKPLEPYQPGSLQQLPLVLYPRIAALLEEYKRSV